MPRALEIKTLAVCAIVFGVLMWILPQFASLKTDPDRFYHFAISRVYATQGYPEVVPQAENVGWAESFGEKEFFYHVLTGLSWYIKQETGVIYLTTGLSAFLIMSLGLILALRTGRWWIVPLAVAWVIIMSPWFFLRMNMIRPHVFAILILTWQMYAWTRFRWKTAVALTFLYVLSYHAIYLPILTSVIFCGCFWLAGRSVSRPLLWLAGAVLGSLLINPTFPNNVAIAFQVIKVATGTYGEIPNEHFGTELRRWPSDTFFVSTAVFLVIPILILLQLRVDELWKTQIKDRELKHPALFGALITSLVFCVFTFFSPRGLEILIPAVVILVAEGFGSVSRWQPQSIVIAVMSGLAYIIPARSLMAAHVKDLNVKVSEDTARALEVIERDKDYKIFHWTWSMSPYIFYHRPDLRFIDLLDPSFMFVQDPVSYKTRHEILSGVQADPYLTIRYDLDSDFVLVPMTEAYKVARDPHFSPLGDRPSWVETGLRVFKVSNQRLPQFVTQYAVGVKKIDKPLETAIGDLGDFEASEPTVSWPDNLKLNTIGHDETQPQVIYVETFANWKAIHQEVTGLSDSETVCQKLKVLPAELERVMQLPGRRYLGIGGGAWLNIKVNGSSVFEGVMGDRGRLLNYFADLGSDDTAKISSIEAISCSPVSETGGGVALSLWSMQELQDFCSAETQAIGVLQRSPAQFAKTNQPGYCLADLLPEKSRKHRVSTDSPHNIR